MSAESSPVKLHLQTITSAFDNFLTMLRAEDWLSGSSDQDIHSCMLSAFNVETFLGEMQKMFVNDELKNCFSELCNYDIDSLCKACDIILEKVLTAPGMSHSHVKLFFGEYVQLCGHERARQTLSSTLIQTEIYRVVLDYIVSAVSMKDVTGLSLQAHLVTLIWNEEEPQKLQIFSQNWLNSAKTVQEVAVALLIIGVEDVSSPLTCTLSQAFVTVLDDRKEPALLFWKALSTISEAIRALVRSSSLLDSALDFLRKSGHWMEATGDMAWISTENGPCHQMGFDGMLSAVQSLLKGSEDMQQKVKLFLRSRRNFQGCTLWDDVQIKLKIY